jgi:hypothetical protein
VKINMRKEENSQFLYLPATFTVNGYDIIWLGFVTLQMVAIFCTSATVVTTTANTVAVTGVI